MLNREQCLFAYYASDLFGHLEVRFADFIRRAVAAHLDNWASKMQQEPN